MSQLIQILLILIYLISIFIFTNPETNTIQVLHLKIHPILVALVSICFGIFVSIIALRSYKKQVKFQIVQKVRKEQEENQSREENQNREEKQD